ncbi:MAG: HD domain-containing protein, partial [Nanoarchaeota archaeon]|nr:HD domain-containing protein [Nanoarchaeota archaeon]
MDKQDIIKQTADYARNTLEGEGSACDCWHVYRVWNNAVHIGKKENADMLVVELAALLHDIADWKFCDGDDSVGPKKAREWLEKLNVDSDVISRACSIIKELSFKGAGVKSEIKTLEGMVVQDADRLDAIGIARAFAYGGHKGREIYNPEIKPVMHESFEQYKNHVGTTVNHFYEKLLLLKDLMNTETGKEIAKERHKIMEHYLARLFR